ncbi:peptidoglycan-recognition protein 3-like [Hyperolius riggenbachi]|uniref:peptidoglycan-recognition protein 3-like n=1 Tax=Hyperolius riggenbachi TaxID=752182 RepID=UPI0035A2CA52
MVRVEGAMHAQLHMTPAEVVRLGEEGREPRGRRGTSRTTEGGVEVPQAPDCTDLTVVSKHGWLAEDHKCAKSIVPLDSSLKKIFIHHTAGPSCTSPVDCEKQMRIIQKYHTTDGLLNDIRYNFLIGGDKKIYEGRGWNSAEYHNKTYLTDSISIAYIGTFPDTELDEDVQGAIEKLLVCAEEKTLITEGAYSVKAYLSEGETIAPAKPALIAEIELLKVPEE